MLLWRVFLVCREYFLFTISFAILNGLVYADNYPKNKNHPRPCSQPGYTVRYEAAICIPVDDEEFTEESTRNCIEHLKNECPEMNLAECSWCVGIVGNSGTKGETIKCNNQEYKFPVCRLRYRASNRGSLPYSWISIAFTNQYGSQGTWAKFPNTMYSILEIHRNIKLHDVFDKDSNDFPGNVPSSTGVQGLAWRPISVQMKTALIGLCSNGTDKNRSCSITVKDMMVYQYTNFGIGSYQGLDRTPQAMSSCRKYIVDGVRHDVCRVVFSNTIKLAGDVKFTQAIAEAQAYTVGNKTFYLEAVYGGNSIAADGSFIW